MPKVSVIVPVYGVECYIERCARSLFEQTLEDMEFIFVDDCTNDDSITILNRVMLDYPHRVPRISIIHHNVNKGLPAARHTGLLYASGDYIAHCDSDDWIDKKMYETMYLAASQIDADIVVCDFIKTDAMSYNKVYRACNSLNISSYIENCLFRVDTWAVWNKLIKREKYEGVLFPEYSMGEDMVITLQILTRCSKLRYVPQPLYYYFINNNSLTNKPSVERCERNFYQMKSNVDMLVSSISDYSLSKKGIKGIAYLKYLVLAQLLPIIHIDNYYSIWRSTYKGLYKSLLFSRYIPLGLKIRFALTALRLYPSRRLRIA